MTRTEFISRQLRVIITFLPMLSTYIVLGNISFVDITIVFIQYNAK